MPYRTHGLTLLRHEEFPVTIELSQAEYIRYLMSETNVEAAISGGMSQSDAWEACWQIFASLFPGGPEPVTFGAVLALAQAPGE